jgi:2-polyprenyl-3-methyl-5-hydroxy-6-metoxy-1,4-benzoquinol methylase
MANKLLKELKFESFRFNDRKQVVISEDTTGKYFIKIEISTNPNKALDLNGEHKIMKKLNKLDCKTCPIAYEFGKIKREDIKLKQDAELLGEEKSFNYIIQQYVPSDTGYGIADVLLSMIEQKKLGVYQGDIKPANIRFDAKTAVCYIIDYDQAVTLKKKEREMSNEKFLDFCTNYDKERYGIGNWTRHFSDINEEDARECFKNGSLDLQKTTIFNTQKTTNSVSGIYHTIDEADIHICGSRTLDTRSELLDSIDFKEGEKVLDVGCNSGLLSMYLHDRGCEVTGVDNDPHIVLASKIASNILQKDINYFHLDLDEAEDLEDYDTIMLFSVFHHTRNLSDNAKKVAEACKRIVIETRLVEQGKQPEGEEWVKTSNWAFNSVEQLITYCENTFTDFKFSKNLGQADKSRYILEFTK